MIKKTFWRCFDPVVKLFMARMEHFESSRGEFIDSRFFQNKANLSPNCIITKAASLNNHWSPTQLSVDDYTFVRGEISVLTEYAGVQIGRYCYIGEGSRIWSQTDIKIGNHVLISHQVDIHDTNAHSLDVVQRREDGKNLFELKKPMQWSFVDSKPITIEDDVWIGFKSSILKGVNIGKGAVVAAGAVVTKDVAPYTLVAGNPAKVIRTLNYLD